MDMHVANQAILHRHTHHTQSGSMVFSHLDMNKGYHQLELNESLRNITTFSIHIGFYRYKQLNYSSRSADEISQMTITEELCMGVTRENMMQNLTALLKRSCGKVTFNKGKCQFNKDRVVYYGFMFSKDGVLPDPCKVKAINLRDTIEMQRNLTDSSVISGIAHDSWNPAYIKKQPPC